MTRIRYSRISGRSSTCGTATRSSRTATSPCCCRTDPTVYAFTRQLPGSHIAGGRQLLRRLGVRAAVPDEPTWASAELVLGNYPPSQGRPDVPDDQIQLRPWEARIYRRAG